MEKGALFGYLKKWGGGTVPPCHPRSAASGNTLQVGETNAFQVSRLFAIFTALSFGEMLFNSRVYLYDQSFIM